MFSRADDGTSSAAAENGDLARRRPERPCDHPDRRRLAGARRPDDPEDRARLTTRSISSTTGDRRTRGRRRARRRRRRGEGDRPLPGPVPADVPRRARCVRGAGGMPGRGLALSPGSAAGRAVVLAGSLVGHGVALLGVLRSRAAGLVRAHARPPEYPGPAIHRPRRRPSALRRVTFVCPDRRLQAAATRPRRGSVLPRYACAAMLRS